MKWSESQIAGFMARHVFERKHLVVVPNCNWTGYECDLLVVTPDLRIVDVEIKITRGDLKADAKKDKWWHGRAWHLPDAPRLSREMPPKVWKHYYALPAEIWKPELTACLPSPASGVILIGERGGNLSMHVERRSKPDRDAAKISAAAAVDIARLASLRMWDAYEARDRAIASQLLARAA